jgi:P pilus assembly chaperone PapD
MKLTLEPTGDSATQSFYVQNDHDETLQIETIPQDRTVTETGEESSVKSEQAAKDLVVYPPIFTLKPFEKRNIRISYRGTNKNPSPELAYRLLIKEIPSKTKIKNKSGTVLYFNYVMAVYVTPPNATYSLETKKVEYTELYNKKTKKNDQLMKLTFYNSGDTHRYFNYYKLILTPRDPELKDKKFIYTEKDGIATNGQNILAKHTREFLVPWPPSLPKGDISVRAEFNN